MLQSIRGSLGDLQTRFRSLFRALIVVAGTTLLANALSFGQEALVARTYGSSPLLDSYVFGFTLVMFLAGVVGNAFGSAVVPAYLRAQESGAPESAASTLGVATRIGLLFLGAVVLVSLLLAPAIVPLLAPRFDEARRSLTLHVVVLFSPIVLFTAFSQAWAGLLNSKGRFAFAGASTAVRPLLVILVLLAAGKPTLLMLAVAVTVGHGGTATVLAAGLHRLGVSVLPRRGPVDAVLLGAKRQYAALVAGALLTSTMLVTDQAVASYFPPGTIATLNYAQKLAALPVGIALAVVGAVLSPKFAVLAAQRDLIALRQLKTQALLLSMGFGTVVGLVIAMFAEPLTRLAFQRGAFSQDDVVAVARLLRITAVQVPLVLAGGVLTRFLVATQYYDKIWAGLAVSPVLNIVLDITLGRRLGIDGVVWSSVGVALYALLYFYVAAAILLAREQRSLARETESEAALGGRPPDP